MAADWNEFITTPNKAAKKLHVTSSDVARGAQIDARRAYLAENARLRAIEDVEAALRAQSTSPRMSDGAPTKGARPDLISNALLGGTLGGVMMAAGLPAVGLRAGLVGGGVTDAVLQAGNPEGGSEVSGGLAALGALGKHSLPAMLALGAAHSADAQAMPFHSWMKALRRSRHGIEEPGAAPLMLNPDIQERMKLWKDAQYQYPQNPTVRIMRDRTNNNTYAVDGSSIVHDDMQKHLGVPRDRTTGTAATSYEDLEQWYDYFSKLPVRKAGGGSIAGAAKRLAHRAMPALTEGYTPLAAPPGALSVVKPKGGNWINNSVEDALRGLKKREMNPLVEPDLIPEINASKSLNNWIEGPLTKYVKTRMASPEDEVRALAEQGILHYEPRGGFARGLYDKRMNAGFPEMGMAKSELAGKWEDVTDAVPSLGTYRDHAPLESFMDETVRDTPSILNRIGGQYAVDNPDAKAYAYNRGKSTQDLGFNHLIDELSNALSPDSGLPRHLQLSPEAVKNMSMEKAVRRVSDINAWRAEQKAAANAELANKAMVVREYTENNPKGLRWVELKAGDDPYTVGSDGKNAADVLEQQLRYEGDTMGHCVGGYCDDVVSGRSRIFSLRDAKGEPYVTVEVRPKWNNKMGKESATEDAIVQIKGKQNRKPNDEYLPFVQDFVRNNPLGGTWGDVGDLGNTGLQDTTKLFRPEAISPWPNRFMSDKEITDWMIKAAPMASGGSVQHTPQNNFQGIIAAIEKELQHA